MSDIDKNYEMLASKLTWYDYPAEKELHAGLLIKNVHGEIFLIGDLLPRNGDGGCGCCADSEVPVAYADIYELVEAK